MSALTALNDAGRRLQAVLDNASVSIFLMDDRQQCIYMNAAAEVLTGFTLLEVLERNEPLHDIIHHRYPDGRHFPLSECAIDRAFPERHQVTGEETFVHKDGSFYPVAFTASPIRDDASNTVGTIIEVRSLASEKALEEERRQAEEQLRSVDILLRSIGESSADLIYAKDCDSRLLYANPATLTVIGKPAEAVIGKTEAEWHHDPREAEAIRENDQRVMRTGMTERLEEVFTTPGGLPLYYRSTKAPLRDPSGEIIGVVGVTTDVTEQRRARDRLELLLGELHHRVKNTLATVQALAFQTFRDSAPEAYHRFESRLAALSRAHDALARDSWTSASMEEVIAAALEPFDMADRIRVSGDDIRVEPKAAVNLAMILHELATNACKYGALRSSGGTVDVQWTSKADADRVRVRLDWVERGVAPIDPPSRTGFGTRLIEHQVRREFNGQLAIEFAPDGLKARFDLRLAVPPQAERLTD